MKIFGSLSLIAIKLSLLACVSFMGVESEVLAKFVPCHGKMVEVSQNTKSTCDMCVQAEDAWSTESSPSMVESLDLVEIGQMVALTSKFFEIKTVRVINDDTRVAYRPPPDVVWKSVQPGTSTTVLII